MEANYLNTGMCEFESSREDDSGVQSAESSKVCGEFKLFFSKRQSQSR